MLSVTGAVTLNESSDWSAPGAAWASSTKAADELKYYGLSGP